MSKYPTESHRSNDSSYLLLTGNLINSLVISNICLRTQRKHLGKNPYDCLSPSPSYYFLPSVFFLFDALGVSAFQMPVLLGHATVRY